VIKPLRLIITGEGGQGVQSVGIIIAKAAFCSGKLATYLPNYGTEQRGGVSVAYVQICSCDEKLKSCICQIGFPKFDKADILINFRERAVKRTAKYVSKDTIYLYDSNLVNSNSLKGLDCNKIAIPAERIASTKLEPKVFNMVILGALIEETGILNNKIVQEVMDEFFNEKYKKKPELKHLNRKALQIGIDMIQKIKNNSKIKV